MPQQIQFSGAYVSLWTQDAARQIDLSPGNTIPIVIPPAQLFDQDLFTWDGWPVRNKDGTVAVIDGWMIYIALSAERTPQQGPVFYEVSEWRYWFRRVGAEEAEWRPGGLVFANAPAPLGSRQWAGSAVYDDETGRATFYYTAVGDVPAGAPPNHPSEYPQGAPAANRPPVEQQIASIEARVVADDSGVRFTDFGSHELILQADGEIYQTLNQSVEAQVIYGFRDPWYYRDATTGQEYILFTANAAYNPGPYNGVVGLAQKQPDGSWTLLPPILQSAGVSSQLERPHLVVRGDRTYLFFTTHSFTFNPTLLPAADDPAAPAQVVGPEGLYGFVGDTLRGQYLPLNGSGLVAGNPPVKPTQTYSYLTLPNGEVMSYLNTAGKVTTLAGWNGSPAPLFEIAMQGTEARVTEAVTPLGRGEADVPNVTTATGAQAETAMNAGNRTFEETLGVIGAGPAGDTAPEGVPDQPSAAELNERVEALEQMLRRLLQGRGEPGETTASGAAAPPPAPTEDGGPGADRSPRETASDPRLTRQPLDAPEPSSATAQDAGGAQ